MYRIVEREVLNPYVTRIVVEAPLVAKKAKAGQFVILRTHDKGERIPLTIADYDRAGGTITLIFQVVGATTLYLNQLGVGDSLADLVGPLGRATEVEGLCNVAVVGGGVGCAIALPVVKALHEAGCRVHATLGFRTQDLVILEREFAAYADTMDRMSDDGSWGQRGMVTHALRQQIEEGNTFDRIITIGPLPMMKAVCDMAKQYGIPSVASMNPIMIDGTGMCGGCRLTVGGKTVFACVDGPEFDGAEIDFDSAILRSRMYGEQERHRYEEACHLLKGGTQNG